MRPRLRVGGFPEYSSLSTYLVHLRHCFGTETLDGGSIVLAHSEEYKHTIDDAALAPRTASVTIVIVICVRHAGFDQNQPRASYKYDGCGSGLETPTKPVKKPKKRAHDKRRTGPPQPPPRVISTTANGTVVPRVEPLSKTDEFVTLL